VTALRFPVVSLRSRRSKSFTLACVQLNRHSHRLIGVEEVKKLVMVLLTDRE
jgi:hypothetical protein